MSENVLCHRLHTGGGKWCWVNGAPSPQCLDDARTFGWELELAYAESFVKAMQARIDELMLEYCPDEMTQEQFDEWERHQVPADVPGYTITEAGRKALEGRK